jgi:hypothetical protein
VNATSSILEITPVWIQCPPEKLNPYITEKIATKEIIAKEIDERERLLSENLLEIKDRNSNNISQHI